MNDLEINDIKIEDMIYEIRGRQVMLDRDLAILYQCTNGTKDINKAVKRNIERFPEDFYFQLTETEMNNLRFQNGTTNMIRVYSHVFTQEGIAMLAATLHTQIATRVSIQIMRTFVALRKYMAFNLIDSKYIVNQVIQNTYDIKLLQESFNKLEKNEKNNHLFFEGQIYDSYSLLMNLLNEADQEIIIIDNYAGKELFDILKDINKNNYKKY